MKKLVILFTVIVMSSCIHERDNIKPIEFYRGKGIIVIREGNPFFNAPCTYEVQCKTKDSVFNIILPEFDAKSLKAGDTIK